jgi:aspartate racemase
MMKKIGLIGGMSWESSQVYYQLINEKVRSELGGFHSARCVMESVDFAAVEKLQHENNWHALDEMMSAAAVNLEKAGAEVVLLCTNTMHLCSDAIKNSIQLPFLHIAEATGQQIKKMGIQKALLLGTRFTMEKDFYKTTLTDKYGLEVLIPELEDREIIHQVIYEELVHGIIDETSRASYQSIVKKSEQLGSEGVILGCTEIPLLIKDQDVDIPIFDTTRIHAESAVEFAIRG